MRKGHIVLHHQKALGRVFPPGGGKINQNLFFPGTCASEKTLLEPASVELGRPLTQGCMQRAATPLKNAGIFEKRVEFFRHAQNPLPNFFGKGGLFRFFGVVQIRFSASSKSAGVSTLRKGAVSSRGMYTVLAQLSRLRMS